MYDVFLGKPLGDGPGPQSREGGVDIETALLRERPSHTGRYAVLGAGRCCQVIHKGADLVESDAAYGRIVIEMILELVEAIQVIGDGMWAEALGALLQQESVNSLRKGKRVVHPCCLRLRAPSSDNHRGSFFVSWKQQAMWPAVGRLRPSLGAAGHMVW